MEVKDFGKVIRNKAKHRAEVSMQTGFPSPATHYMERTVDLNEELIKNKNATFFVRIAGSAWENLHIYKDDVLLIDRSESFTKGKIALVIIEGNFEIIEYPSAQKNVKTYEFWGVVSYAIHQL